MAETHAEAETEAETEVEGKIEAKAGAEAEAKDKAEAASEAKTKIPCRLMSSFSSFFSKIWKTSQLVSQNRGCFRRNTNRQGVFGAKWCEALSFVFSLDRPSGWKRDFTFDSHIRWKSQVFDNSELKFD